MGCLCLISKALQAYLIGWLIEVCHKSFIHSTQSHCLFCGDLCFHSLSSLTLPPSVVLLDSSWKDVTSHPFSLILSITVLRFVCVLLTTIARLAKYYPHLRLSINHGFFHQLKHISSWNCRVIKKMHPKLIICILNVIDNKFLSTCEKRCTAIITHIHAIKLCLELMQLFGHAIWNSSSSTQFLLSKIFLVYAKNYDVVINEVFFVSHIHSVNWTLRRWASIQIIFWSILVACTIFNIYDNATQR